MAEVPIERRFAGQARLVRLLLWRVGDTTELDACFAEARAAGMIGEDDEAFLRACLATEEAQRASDGSGAPARSMDISEETVARLQRCADRLNRADSA